MKSTIQASIVLDSVNTVTGDRITTFRVRIAKFLVAEINRHRALSQSWASSRAIPSKVLRRQVIDDPFVPIHWGKNQKGMSAETELTGLRLTVAKKLWLYARYLACAAHWLGEWLGLHKQLNNRFIEPWMWADGVMSATEWHNFFLLRCDESAQPELRCLALQMRSLYQSSKPTKLYSGQTHMPFIDAVDIVNARNHIAFEADNLSERVTLQLAVLKRMSAARCARTTYLLRDGQRPTVEKDLSTSKMLFESVPPHLSPSEHVAEAMSEPGQSGNFSGWKQFRKEFKNESGRSNADESTIATDKLRPISVNATSL